jgi:hypothetical protein
VVVVYAYAGAVMFAYFSRSVSCRHLRADAVLTGRQLSRPRYKSYVLKFVRGHLPEDLKDLQGAVGCLYGPLPDADEYGGFQMPRQHLDQYHTPRFHPNKWIASRMRSFSLRTTRNIIPERKACMEALCRQSVIPTAFSSVRVSGVPLGRCTI